MVIPLLATVLTHSIKNICFPRTYNLYRKFSHVRMSSSIKIGTHSGQFHCDEALACFLLKTLPRYKDATIIRSRDKSILDTCDIVVDVGGVYDPSKHRYDHHMRDFKETLSTVINKPGFDCTIKLSSAGLIYCHFGLEIIRELLLNERNEMELEQIFKNVYDSFIKEIDAIDNGIPMTKEEPLYFIKTDLSSRVGRLNPSWNSVNVNIEEQFLKAVELTGEEFMYFVNHAANVWLPARTIVEKSLQERFQVDPSGEIMILPQIVTWSEHLYSLEKELNIDPTLKFVIFADETYRVRAVPLSDKSFVPRIPLPEAWAGLRDNDLCKVSGIDDAVFVHAVRFIGGHKTKEGALAMARKSLEIAKSLHS